MSKYERLPASKPCVVYSFGIQFESSWEEAILERTHCEIWGYDYSVDKFGDALRPDLKTRAHFLKAGISGHTDTKRKPSFYSIQDLMRMNEHEYIDILKIDIEESEFESLRSLMQAYDGVPIGQIMVEIHLRPGLLTTDEFLKWWEELEVRFSRYKPSALHSTRLALSVTPCLDRLRS